MVEFLPAEAVVLQQGVRQFEGRIHQDARNAVEQFRIHAPHRGADNEVGMLTGAQVLQEGKGLFRLDGQVRREHPRRREQYAQRLRAARGAAGSETVQIEERLSGQQVGPGV